MRPGLFVCLLILCILDYVNGKANIELRFLRYRNSVGRDYDGDKCDPASTGCDTYFKLCVVYPLTSSPDSSSTCAYSNRNRPYIESNDIDFQTEDTGIDKTITIFGFIWSGRIGFYMEIHDSDYSADDLIDQHSYIITQNAGSNGTVISKTYTSYGSRPSYKTTVTFELKVNCYTDWYGSGCSKNCRYTDDTTGHYKCNNNGDRVCLDNWYNKPNCLTYCVPHDDGTNGHYTCDSTGSRVCRSNWYNLPKCLKRCVPQNDDINGHFKCNNNGARVCLENWYNLPNCTTYCKPQNDTINGNYACSGAGERVCHEGWYGDKCTVCCKPRDDASGHFNCSSTGEKICFNDWYGINCDRYCKASSNASLEYYNCSISGEKICFQNYYGENCTNYCFVNNTITSDKHYICDKKSGDKKCDMNWTGRFCNVSIIVSSMSSELEIRTSTMEYSSAVITPTFWSTAVIYTTVYASSTAPLEETSALDSTKTTFPTTSFSTDHLVMESSNYATKLLSIASSAKPTTTKTSVSSSKYTTSLKPTSTVVERLSSSSIRQNTVTTSYTSSRKIKTTSLLKTSSIRPSKSSSVISQPKTKTIDKSKQGNQNPEGIKWLTSTDDGKIVLGGSAFALFFLIALAIAVTMYMRLPKNTQQNRKKYKKDIDDDNTDDFNVEDLMHNAHVNPLYEDDPMCVAKHKSLELQTKKSRSSKKNDVHYEKPLTKESSISKDDDALTEHENSNFGVIQNPLYGVSVF